MKENKKNKVDSIMVILLILGVFLLIVGLAYHVPSRKFAWYSIEEYVGGDAYNCLIEASILGGEIAGAKMSKALYTCSGLTIISLSLFRMKSKK